MIIPAIDVFEQRIVRLFQGDYAKTRFYDIALIQLVQSYAAAGATIIHIIDLEGARNPEKRQLDLIKQVTSETDVKLQVGGGIRSEQDVEELLEAGIERVIIGSLAVQEPATVRTWIKNFGQDHIVLALDVSIDGRGNKWLPTRGWAESSGKSLESTLDSYQEARHVLCTDISRDGTLEGSNTSLYQELVKVYPNIKWQASGGIGSLQDIYKVVGTGVAGVIVGRALLDGSFKLEEAIQCWQGE